MIEAGIVGGTGYTGVELLRLLSGHDQVNIRAITSRTESGKPVSDLYPNLRGHVDMAFGEPDISVLSDVTPVTSVDAIEVGTHGLIVVKGKQSGLLLPQVPVDFGWDR